MFFNFVKHSNGSLGISSAGLSLIPCSVRKSLVY
jgi:hypothetical protein